MGAKPVFVDVREDTSNLDPTLLKDKITDKTKAIIPVHLYGQPVDMDPILQLAQKHQLVVIEDACQAHGALYKGKKAGSFGAAGCFSFYPGKNLGAFGEAGAVVTQDKGLADRMSMIRDHGQEKKYYHLIEGYNGRLDAIQAAVLRIKLKYLPQWNSARHQNALYYNELLAGLPGIVPPVEASFATSVFHVYSIQTKNRDALQTFLGGKGIATGMHYPLPLHIQAAYNRLGYKKGDFPVAEKLSENLLSLPMFPELTREQIEYICRAIKEFVQK